MVLLKVLLKVLFRASFGVHLGLHFTVSFRVSLGLGFLYIEFHLGFFPVSCRVSYRDFLSGVLNVQTGFFRDSLGFI